MFRLIKLMVVLAVVAAGYLYLSFGTVQPCAALQIALVKDAPDVVREAARSTGGDALASLALRAVDPNSPAFTRIVEEFAARWVGERSDVECAIALGQRLIAPESYRDSLIDGVRRAL